MKCLNHLLLILHGGFVTWDRGLSDVAHKVGRESIGTFSPEVGKEPWSESQPSPRPTLGKGALLLACRAQRRGNLATVLARSTLTGKDAGFSDNTNSALHLFPSLDEESVLPLLAQDSNSKARRGILRRAVFSEDQRKALEKMFQKQKYISKIDRKKLAINLGLKESQVLRSRKMATAPDFWVNTMGAIHLANTCCTRLDPEALLKLFS